MHQPRLRRPDRPPAAAGQLEAQVDVIERDLCLKLAGRGSDKTAGPAGRLDLEAHAMRERWGERLAQDPYYSPNLTLADESFTLAAKSRAEALWKHRG